MPFQNPSCFYHIHAQFEEVLCLRVQHNSKSTVVCEINLRLGQKHVYLVMKSSSAWKNFLIGSYVPHFLERKWPFEQSCLKCVPS